MYTGLWHVPLEKGIGNQNTGVWILTLPEVKNKSTLSPWLFTGRIILLGDPENYRCKAVQKNYVQSSVFLPCWECMLHSYAELCIKVSTLAFPSLFILAPILYLDKPRHVKVCVIRLESFMAGVMVESTG